MTLKSMLLASVFTLGLAAPGRAADVTDDQARAVAEQLRGFLTGILTDRVPLPADLMTVTPAGSAYTIAVRSAAGPFVRSDDAGQPTTAWVTATVRPEEGTRWHIDSLKFPASLRVTPDGWASLTAGLPKTAATAALDAGPAPSLEWRTRTQSASGIFDTALASDSRLEFQMEGIGYDAKNIGHAIDSHVTADRLAGWYLMHPTASGGVDYKGEATIDGYATVSNNPELGAIRLKSRHIEARGDTGALKFGQVADLIRVAINLGMDAAAAKTDGPDAKAQNEKAARAGLHAIISALRGIMSGVQVQETFQGVEVEVPAGRGTAEKAGIALGGEAPGDSLKAFLEFSAGGLQILGLPPAAAGFVPRSFVVRPTVANIDLKALTRLADDATADGADTDLLKSQLLALFTTGGVKVGFEHLDADIGYASMVGSGEATIVGPTAVQGSADITVVHFDALMEHVQALPDPAQAIAVLAMAKGFGKAQGDKTVWHIEVSPDQKILVNGVDVTGGGAKGGTRGDARQK